MAAHEKGPEEPPSWFQQAWSYVSRLMGWLTLVFWLVLLLAVIVIKSGLINPPPEQAVAFYVLMVATLVAVQSRHIVELYKRLRARLATQSEEIRQLRDAMHKGTELFRLDEALADLKSRVERLPKGEVVTIRHLGLDLTNAWREVRPTLEKLSKRLQINYRLLMLGGAGKEASSLPPEVQRWIELGTLQRQRTERDLARIASAAAPPGKLQPQKIRTYCELPVVHGFSVEGPVSVAYIALSRWIGDDCDEFDWGVDCYHRVLDKSPGNERDLLDVFGCYFEHWWRIAPEADD